MSVRRALGLAAAVSLAMSAGSSVAVKTTSSAKRPRTAVTNKQNSVLAQKVASGAICAAAAIGYCAMRGRKFRKVLRLANEGTVLAARWATGHRAEIKNVVGRSPVKLHLWEFGNDVKFGAQLLTKDLGSFGRDVVKGVAAKVGAEWAVDSAGDKLLSVQDTSKGSPRNS